jgi:hypothetical protein
MTRHHGAAGVLITTVAALALVAPASAASGDPGPEKHANSLNRAGYGMTGQAIRHLSAAWRQPSATCGSIPTYASFRVSIARVGRPLMVGTATDCHAGHPVFYAWSNFSGSRQKLGGDVAAGDLIKVTVDASGRPTTFEIDNQTQDWGEGAAAGDGAPKHFTRADLLVQARTAHGRVLPLTDFDQVFFRRCMVNNEPLGGWHTREIRMKTPLGDKALPTPIARDSNFAVLKPAG